MLFPPFFLSFSLSLSFFYLVSIAVRQKTYADWLRASSCRILQTMATHASPQLGGARCDKTLAGLLSNDYSVLWISMQNGGINLAILLQLHAILVDQNLINFFLSLSLSVCSEWWRVFLALFWICEIFYSGDVYTWMVRFGCCKWKFERFVFGTVIRLWEFCIYFSMKYFTVTILWLISAKEFLFNFQILRY